MKPVLFVTNHVAPDRAGAFDALAQRVPLEVVTFGGRTRHGAPPVPYGRAIAERDVHRLVRGGDWSAVIAGTAGRLALPSAYLAARRTRTPFVLWASLWAHPRTTVHALSYLPTRAIYRGADAVVTYGEHVSAYVRAHGARTVHIAPQSVDNAFWSAPAGEPGDDTFTVLFAGRDAPEKGLAVLREAWDDGPGRLHIVTGGATPEELRNFYARAHVLVMPSLRTRDFREPWGLVANEAMNQRTAIIASDQVGAAAGGLVRHERNGLIVPAGDPAALRAALVRLRDDGALRAHLAANGARDVAAFTHDAWAAGFEAALRELETH
jgi:glycosyltransferase involved in cell wall biosynthesis